MKIRDYFGTKQFYRSVLAVAVPIMLQNGITNFVSMLDNIMVGRLSTEAISAVSIVGEFFFVFYLMVFGAISGAGIFTAQYHGSGDVDGVRNTFRFKFLVSLAATVLFISVLSFFREPLISLFLHEGSDSGDLALTLDYAKQYLGIMLIGMLPYTLSCVYASTLRETEETIRPLLASIAAVATNFVLNYLLIFGKFGCPALGVRGAAIATVVSRFVELIILVVPSHLSVGKYPFLRGVYRSFRIPRTLVRQIAVNGLPLMFNELFWSLSLSIRTHCYSLRGLEVVAAQNIFLTVSDVFSVVYLALGTAVGILIGKTLGEGKIEEAKVKARRLLVLTLLASTVMSVLMAICAPFFPLIYNVSEEARSLATFMILFFAAMMPFCSIANSAYFAIRSGGKIFITVLFDSGFMWAVVVPLAMIFGHGTDMPIRWLFAICQGTEVLKAFIGLIFLRRGSWARQLVDSEKPAVSAPTGA